MAFNPFRGFRKHQKVIFAGLTILCMFTFVGVSSISMFGGGDAFSEVARMFGGSGKAATDVARLYGSRVDRRDIDTVRNQRRAANEYMAAAVQLAHNNLFEKVYDALQYNKENKERQRQTMSMWQGLASRGDFPQAGPQYIELI